VNEREASKESILSDSNSALNKKIFTPSKEISHLVESTEFWGVKGNLMSNMTASNINIPSVKIQHNPQFFRNRNNKN
jgi:hypothetical protein